MTSRRIDYPEMQTGNGAFSSEKRPQRRLTKSMKSTRTCLSPIAGLLSFDAHELRAGLASDAYLGLEILTGSPLMFSLSRKIARLNKKAKGCMFSRIIRTPMM